MDNRRLHTPEGVRDIYGDEMLKKLALEKTLREVIASYGYQDIEIPSFEFFDIFSREIGTTPSREIYKFFDSENNTLALRPDFTPGVARAAVKYFMEEKLPIRLCYLGNTFSNRSDLQGKLKEVTEIGVEHMGDGSLDADAEMIALAADLLKAAGLRDFQICVGTAEYFRGLCEAAGLSEETAEELSDHIRNKNYFGTLDMLNDVDVPEEIRDILSTLSDFFGTAEVLETAQEKVGAVRRSRAAVEHLLSLHEKLKIWGADSYVTYDLGMLTRQNYYTGIVFRAYTFGSGEPIVRGGRYDNLLGQFGKPGAAIGLTVVVDQLLHTLLHRHIEIPLNVSRILICYTDSAYEEAVREAGDCRKRGEQAELLRVTAGMTEEMAAAHARRIHADSVKYFR